ncbi:N-formylglutamate amidohydrolase [Nguyenibacter vanlangensis]|uniref:N-formylglutamate amidohydrolase n=1 Tax=Nguyenibacter vanlangensis TaxID=1216886 RepID=A0ABZ3D8X8_9PROT
MNGWKTSRRRATGTGYSDAAEWHRASGHLKKIVRTKMGKKYPAETHDQSAAEAVQIVNPAGRSPYLLLCEHASSFIPAEYGELGLPPDERLRHIAWDIGAREVALSLAEHLDAPLVLGKVSRLVIDLNRPLHSDSSIPVSSEVTEIPGNMALSPHARQERQRRWFHPFHDLVGECLNRRAATGQRTLLVGIHSFTPVFKGERRPWPAGILFGQAGAYGRAFIRALSASSGSEVAENNPYQIKVDEDYAVPVHGDARGIPACLVEIRQDLITESAGALQWSGFLAHAARVVQDEAF